MATDKQIATGADDLHELMRGLPEGPYKACFNGATYGHYVEDINGEAIATHCISVDFNLAIARLPDLVVEIGVLRRDRDDFDAAGTHQTRQAHVCPACKNDRVTALTQYVCLDCDCEWDKTEKNEQWRSKAEAGDIVATHLYRENEGLRALNAELVGALKGCLPNLIPIAAIEYERARAVLTKATAAEKPGDGTPP